MEWHGNLLQLLKIASRMFMIKRSGWTSDITEDFVQKVVQRLKHNRCFKILSLSDDFPRILRSILYETVNEPLNYRTLCARWVPKILTDMQKTQCLGSALSFLRYDGEGTEFLAKLSKTLKPGWFTVQRNRSSSQWNGGIPDYPRELKSKQNSVYCVLEQERGYCLFMFCLVVTQ